MADAQKTIDLIFNGIDKTGAATLSALENAKSFTGSLKNVTQPVADFTLGAVKLEAGLLAAGVAMTVFATHTAGSFEQSFSQITTLFDASDTDLKTFKDNIQTYAASSGKSIGDIMASLQAAIGSGVKYTDALDLMTVAEKLAIATKADMKGTTEVLVSTMNAYGMSTKDAGGLADLMFQIIKDGKIEMDDLSRSLAMVTPIAAASGVSMKEVGAAVAVLTASGIAPATAIEYLRSAISNIIKPSEQATKLAAELGIQFDANALKSKGLAGVLDDVAKATGGNAGPMAKLIGDVGGLVGAMVLTGPQAEKFKETLTSMGNSAGSVAVAYEKMAGSMDVNKQKVINAFTGLMTAIGTPMLDEFGGIAEAIANIFLAIATSAKEGALKDVVTYIEGLFGDLKTTLDTLAANLPAALEGADFSGFTGGIDTVVTALKNLFSGLDLGTVDGLQNAIELAGLAFLGLSKYVGGVIDVFKPLFDKMVDVGTGAKDMDLSFLTLAGNIGGIATALNVVLPLFGGLLAILTAKQTLGLVADLQALPGVVSAVSTSLGAAGLAGAIAGPAGLTVAAAAAGYGVGTVLAGGIDSLLSSMTGSKTTLGAWIYDLTHSGDAATDMGTKTGAAAKGVDTLQTAVKDSKNPFEDANNAMLKSGGIVKTTGEEWGKSATFMDLTATAAKNAAAASKELGTHTEDLKTKASGISPIFDALTGKIIGYEQSATKSGTASYNLSTAAGKAGESLAKVAKETKDAEDAQRKWNQEVAKMAFEEKLKLIDSQTKITTANIEADAKKTVAAFESISNSITSTGNVLTGLFGQFQNFDKMGFSEQWKIIDQVNTENKLRQDAFELQKRLTEAQIAMMKAQTDALVNGEGLIKIDGAGLKPHLEAFMWEILSAIRVKVNKDGLKMLLGT